LFVASAGALVGVFADRALFVIAGQIVPVTAASGVVSSPYAGYSPSAVEIAIVVGAGAFVALGYTLAERYLDLSESELHFGFPVVAAARRARSGGVALYGSLVARWQRPAAEPWPDDGQPVRVMPEGVPPAAVADLEVIPSEPETSASATPGALSGMPDASVAAAPVPDADGASTDDAPTGPVIDTGPEATDAAERTLAIDPEAEPTGIAERASAIDPAADAPDAPAEVPNP
jgi:hypothetical protein